MHWIDERIKEYNDRQERKRNIEKESPRMFSALWTQLVEDIEAANQTEYIGIMRLLTEGNALLHEAGIVRPWRREGLRAQLSLSEDRHSIIVSGNVRLKFHIRPCGDGRVCLQYDSHEIDIKEAARLILDPLLFPDLQKPEFPS